MFTLILSVLSPTTHWNEAFQIVPEKHPTIDHVDQPSFQPQVDTYVTDNQRALNRIAF